jgi:hypothetical protein
MNYPDFSNIFPSPNVNYPCIFNPNSGYATDCVGATQTGGSSTQSTTTKNNEIVTIGNKQILILPNNIACTYDPSKSPPLDCRDQYCNYYYDTNLLSTAGFNPPISHPPVKIVCRLNSNICTYDPSISPKLICDDQQCKYFYNDPRVLNDLKFNPPFSTNSKSPSYNSYECILGTPSNYQPTYVANYAREPSVVPTDTNPNTPPPTLLPTVLKSFTLNKWALPITIPSNLTADDTTSGNPPDPAVTNNWIQPPYAPYPTFSDLYPDPDPTHKGQPFKWPGFKEALSKCIELDGSTYPQSNNICSSTNNDRKCIDPLLAYPNKKPKCYAVAVQSDYIGNEIQDTSRYSLNYFLVEEPNSSPSSSLTNLNNSVQTQNGQKWVDGNAIDNNYLFCQTQFYTWIKNTPSDTPYNSTTPCTPVSCPRGPIVCPSPSPSASPSASSSKKCIPCTPVICPVGSPRTNFNVNTCPGPIYSNHKANESRYVDLNPPPSFYEEDVLPTGMYKAPPPKANPYTNYIIGGAVVVLLGLIYYFVLGPGAEGDTIIPVKKAVKVVKTLKKIGKKIGGYFYYYNL